MKKLVATSLVFCSVLALSPSAMSKQPKYKAIFNLASDPGYYKYVEYLPSHRSENPLQLVVLDKRPAEEKVYNEDIQWFYDDIWTEPPSSMLKKIFLRELRKSRMFKSVDLVRQESSLVLEIELTSFIGHYYGEGRVAKGEVKIHSILKYPPGNRIIMDKKYEGTSSYQVHRFAKGWKHICYHIGKALHTVVQDMMVDLENAILREKEK